uniref:Meis_PKNOX_N domain-containing protein n=1 Tax=Strongyloides papillosus TaxID=174720 RepID=A0A0N5CGD0_STREA
MRTGDKEVDDFMINTIIQLRKNMVELTKVGYYCEEFKTKYIKNFAKVFATQNTFKPIFDDEDDIKNGHCDDYATVLSEECSQIVVDKNNDILISFLNGEQSLLKVLNNPQNSIGTS